jgi:hypothetical protein
MNVQRSWLCSFVVMMAGLVPGVSHAFLLEQPARGFGTGRTISGTGVAQGWMVFQPFDVPAPGWDVTTIGMDGWTVQDPGQVGFTGTLFPDDGTGNAPNEASPIASAVYFQSSDPNSSHWVDRPFNVTLFPGRYWMRWSANDANHWSAIYLSNVGLPSWSRRLSDGARFNAGPTTLRIDGTIIPEPATAIALALGVSLVAIRRKRTN